MPLFRSKAKFAWGLQRCGEFETTIIGETGLVGPNPAVRVRVNWVDLPSALKSYIRMYVFTCFCNIAILLFIAITC